ncbi:hypothetical protein C7S18_07050 [Ahniella affigens]|uniref:Alpha-2-macroglobulin n=1 Tax=Ahniella affigens TaxID=2021234 RepID=A0A2P1PQ68_9GAMM|nr:alpha-2-macroglobulin [Ahniella affigens]AVP96968.1 hypothetical protein C7S18_07050 [Ahniella affigens]
MWQMMKDGWTWASFFAGRLFAAVAGEWQWTPPRWVQRLGRALRANFKPLLALGLAILAGWWGYDWWQSRPKPPEPENLTASLEAPGLTNYVRSPPEIKPLRLHFDHPAKPIDAKDLAKGFILKPALNGRWVWTDETNVAFEPSDDWAIGQTYEVRLEPESCCAKVRPLGETRFEFTTEPFVASVGSREFYQDPTDPKTKRALFELKFSHPVDSAALETRVQLRMVDAKGKAVSQPEYALTYAPNRLSARIQSAPLVLPDEGGQVVLNVGAGLTAMRGSSGTGSSMEDMVSLPARNSLVVQMVDSTVVTNAAGNPEQVLLVGLNQEVDEQALMKKLRFRLLPIKTVTEKDPDPVWYQGSIPEPIQKQSEALRLDLIAGEREVSDTHSFRINLEPGRQVLVDVDGGLTSFGNFVMPKKYQTLISAPDFPKMLQFVGDGALLSLRGERRLSVASRNVPLAQLTVARVRPEELHHLVRFNDGQMAKPSLRGLGRDDLTDRFSEVLETPAEQSRSAIRYSGVDLGKYWTPEKRGVFMISLRAISQNDVESKAEESDDPFSAYDYYDYYDDDGSSLRDSRLVVLTDLGVLAKTEKDGKRQVFVQSLSRGTPVAGAMVSVLARNGARVINVQTNSDGVASLPDFDNLVREREATLLLVESGEDASFLPLREYGRAVDYSRFDIGGEATPLDKGTLRGYLFSDRGMYRPGETLHLGTIVRREDWQALPVGAPLELRLTDPRGIMVASRPLALDASGFNEFSHELSGIAPTGTYEASLVRWLDDKHVNADYLGTTTVRVKEFQPDRMKLKSRFAPVASALWLSPDGLLVEADLEHLFGGSATGNRVTAKVRLRPVDPVLPGFEDYAFPRTPSNFETQEFDLDEVTTDEQGHVQFDPGVSGVETPIYQMDVMLEAFEAEGGRSVMSDLSSRISSRAYLLAIKADEQNLVLSRNADRSVHWLSIDANGKPVDPDDLRFELVERRYVSILTRGNDDLYRYESRLKEIPVLAQPITFKQGKASLKLPTSTPGEFRLRVFDREQTQLLESMVSVAGSGNTARALDRNAELKVKLLNPEPEQGETLSVSIEAPYLGAGLITIEREHVLAHAWFKIDATRSVQTIALPADLEGQAYVTVHLLRALDSPEIFMSPLSYAAAPFKIKTTPRNLQLTIDAPAKHRPGEDLPVQLTSSNPARVALFAVDEGILQAAGYRLVDPKDTFFAKRQLEVNTAQILDLVLPEFSLLTAAPGGDAEGALARHLNPFKRKLDKPAVYWAGIQDVDGTASFAVPVPDSFNGRLRVMAVAVNPDQIGIVEKTTDVRAPFVLSPSAPAFVSPGDEFELGLSINREPGNGKPETELLIQADQGLSIVGAGKQTLSLAPGKETSLRVKIKAEQQLGAGRIRITASSGVDRSTRSLEVSLRPLMPYKGQQQLGRFDGKQKTLNGLRALWPNFAKRDLIAGHTPLVMIGAIHANLEDFPHQCSEQLASQAMGSLLLVRYPDYASKPVPGDYWTGVFDVLRARSNESGGLGLWVAEEDANVFVSAWAGLMFLEAESAGVLVPRDLVQKNLGFLQSLSADDENVPRFERWLSLYVRARRGEVVTLPMQGLLQSERADAPDGLGSRSLRAAIRMLLQDQKTALLDANGMVKEFQSGITSKGYEIDGYVNPVMARNLALMVLYRHFPEQAKGLPSHVFSHLELAVNERLMNTVSAGSAALALAAQAQRLSDLGGSKDLSLSWLDAAKKSGMFGVQRQLDVRGDWPEPAVALNIVNQGALPVWYSLRESGFEKKLPATPQQQGLELARDYLTLDGKAIGALKEGDEIEVSLRIRATDLRNGQLAIVELLPAGFELQEYPTDEYAPREARFLAFEPGALTFLDAREDRLVLYASGTEAMQTYKYRIKATQRGKFRVPPTYAEDMYDPRRQSIGAETTVLTVE